MPIMKGSMPLSGQASLPVSRAPGDIQAAVDAEIRDFVAAGPAGSRRSAAVRALDTPEISAAVNGEVPMPGGSTLKLISALAVLEATDLDLDARVRVSDLGRTMYPSVLQAFDAGAVLSVREVCAFSLITSDNPAAEYIRTLAGEDRCQRVIGRLGLSGTAFPVGFGDDRLGRSGRPNVTSASDMLRTVTYIADAPHLDDLRRYLLNNQRNQRIPSRLDDDIPVMHKTGSFTGVVNDVGVVYHPKARLALAFLTDGELDNVAASIEIGIRSDNILKIVTDDRL